MDFGFAGARPVSMESQSRDSGFRLSVFVLGGLVVLMWALEIIDCLFLHQSLDRYGVQPRRLVGLRGIVFAPFLHAGFRHLGANTVPLIVLGGMILARRLSDFVVVTVVAAVIGGLGVWLFGRSHTVHIGASGLIFGYFGFLLTCAVLERSARSIAAAVAVILLYGGLIWGLRPFQGQVSWLGHVFGLLGGVEAAHWLARRKRAATRGGQGSGAPLTWPT